MLSRYGYEIAGALLVWAVGVLKEWHDFYMLVGTAGATLLALLFLAVSLGTGFLTEERQSATRTFMSPVALHFTSVFFPIGARSVTLEPYEAFRRADRHYVLGGYNYLDLRYGPGGAHRHDELC